MTLEEARIILNTYEMPLTEEELLEYKEALRVAAGAFALLPPTNQEDPE